MQYNEKFIARLSNYHCDRRKRKYEKKGVVVRNIGIHNFFHRRLVPIIKVLRKIRKQNLIVLNDERQETDRAIIYAVTHIGGNDVEIAFEAIKTPAYLFLGDPKELYCNFDGLMLYLNGVICVETRDKEDRNVARTRAVGLLKKGGNLIIYPEGAWNISDNLLVLPIYAGALEIAVEAKADIVPIAIEKYENIYYVNIGKNISYEQIDLSNKTEAAVRLRDIMATLKWEEFEIGGVNKRESIPKGYSRIFVNRIMNAKETSYVEQDVYDSMYQPKGVTEPSEAFAFMDKLMPCEKNAFLFRKNENGLIK